MTPGSDNYNIDGLDWNWFVKTSLHNLYVKVHSNLLKQEENPKANGKSITLCNGSPRDKIFKKQYMQLLKQSMSHYSFIIFMVSCHLDPFIRPYEKYILLCMEINIPG